jgi:hypothetical protein
MYLLIIIKIDSKQRKYKSLILNAYGAFRSNFDEKRKTYIIGTKSEENAYREMSIKMRRIIYVILIIILDLRIGCNFIRMKKFFELLRLKMEQFRSSTGINHHFYIDKKLQKNYFKQKKY